MDKPVHGFLFDLDNTLIDREAAFIRFASHFYKQHLRNATTMSREEVVARMVLWDEDGYVDREKMFARWIDEWPEAGLEPERLLPYYRSEMKQHVQPDADNNRLLADLNRRGVPWGIVTNGKTATQHIACQAAGLDQLAPFIIVSEAAGYAKPDPKDFPRRTKPHRPRFTRTSDVRRRQPTSRHRRRQAFRNENRMGSPRSTIPARSPAPRSHHRSRRRIAGYCQGLALKFARTSTLAR